MRVLQKIGTGLVDEPVGECGFGHLILSTFRIASILQFYPRNAEGVFGVRWRVALLIFGGLTPQFNVEGSILLGERVSPANGLKWTTTGAGRDGQSGDRSSHSKKKIIP
jgi:hypothetical protein